MNTRRKAPMFLSLLLVLGFGTSNIVSAATPPYHYGLLEGDVIRAEGDEDVFIVNQHGYKRLFVNEAIFGLYGHLGFDKVRVVSSDVRDAFPTSGLFKNCESGDGRVFGLDVVNDDVANLRLIDVSDEQAQEDDPDLFRKVFCINNAEQRLYGTGPSFSSVLEVPDYNEERSQSDTITSTPVTSEHTPASVYAAWAVSVPQLLCFDYEGGDEIVDLWGGSGTLMRNRTGVIQLITNDHVVPDDGFCLVEFWVEPGLNFAATSKTFVYAARFSGHLSRLGEDDEAIMSLEPVSSELIDSFRDGGLIDVDVSFPESLSETTQIAQRDVCGATSAQVGDEVAIIGFPAIGSTAGPTLTRGNISGREDAYYITDAKIEQGNSGGAAILIKNNCYLGIPTFVVSGANESLGRILDITRFQVFGKSEQTWGDVLKANVFDVLRKFF